MKSILKRFLISSQELTATLPNSVFLMKELWHLLLEKLIREFKNNKLNKLLDYSLLKNSIVNDLENNCQVYDFEITKLENLKFN